MKPPISRWSFSSLREYERCPYALYLARVEKAPKPAYDDDPNHPLTRGSRVHKEAELYIQGQGALTRDLRKLEDELNGMRERFPEGQIQVEQVWAFDNDWTPTDPAWDNPDHKATIICDVVEKKDGVVIVTDWKTGKSFGKDVAHTQQLQLYAVAALMKYPDVDLVEARLGYLDEGKVKTKRYARNALGMLLPMWGMRSKKLLNALVFPAKANRGNCRFCDFSRNGQGTGVCAYSIDFA